MKQNLENNQAIDHQVRNAKLPTIEQFYCLEQHTYQEYQMMIELDTKTRVGSLKLFLVWRSLPYCLLPSKTHEMHSDIPYFYVKNDVENYIAKHFHLDTSSMQMVS